MLEYCVVITAAGGLTAMSTTAQVYGHLKPPVHFEATDDQLLLEEEPYIQASLHTVVVLGLCWLPGPRKKCSLSSCRVYERPNMIFFSWNETIIPFDNSLPQSPDRIILKH